MRIWFEPPPTDLFLANKSDGNGFKNFFLTELINLRLKFLIRTAEAFKI